VWQNFTLEYLVIKGAQRSKLILGVPMYGQSFQLSNPGDSNYGSESVGLGEPGAFTQQPGMLSYYEICKNGSSLNSNDKILIIIT
jgi:chitinase